MDYSCENNDDDDDDDDDEAWNIYDRDVGPSPFTLSLTLTTPIKTLLFNIVNLLFWVIWQGLLFVLITVE